MFHPGLLPGGRFTHTCHNGRSIGYYLEVLIPMAPFCKKPMDIIMNGITGEEGRDMTVSYHAHEIGQADYSGGYDQDSDATASSSVWNHGWARITSKLIAFWTRGAS